MPTSGTQPFFKKLSFPISWVLRGSLTIYLYHLTIYQIHHLNYPYLLSYWPRRSVSRASVDLIGRSWVQTPPRSIGDSQVYCKGGFGVSAVLPTSGTQTLSFPGYFTGATRFHTMYLYLFYRYSIQQCMDIFGPTFNDTNIQDGATQTNTNYGGYGIASSKVSRC